jgi:hypothetical protein
VLAGTAVKQGSVDLPDLDVNLGAARLVGNTTEISLCPQFLPCLLGEPSPVMRVYTLWLVNRGDLRKGQQSEIRRLLALPLGERLEN